VPCRTLLHINATLYRLPELIYPFHDRDIIVAACERIWLHRKKIIVCAGQTKTRY
jgi:hypothetical protein